MNTIAGILVIAWIAIALVGGALARFRRKPDLAGHKRLEAHR